MLNYFVQDNITKRKKNGSSLLTFRKHKTLKGYCKSFSAHAGIGTVSYKIQVLYRRYKHIPNIVMRGGMFDGEKEAYTYR
jgi:hypothetical protein